MSHVRDTYRFIRDADASDDDGEDIYDEYVSQDCSTCSFCGR